MEVISVSFEGYFHSGRGPIWKILESNGSELVLISCRRIGLTYPFFFFHPFALNLYGSICISLLFFVFSLFSEKPTKKKEKKRNSFFCPVLLSFFSLMCVSMECTIHCHTSFHANTLKPPTKFIAFRSIIVLVVLVVLFSLVPYGIPSEHERIRPPKNPPPASIVISLSSLLFLFVLSLCVAFSLSLLRGH